MIRQDARRLGIENDHESPSETNSLIREVIPRWTLTQLHEFQALVCAWNPYRDDEYSKYAFEHRAKLLSLVPKIHRTAEASAALATSERFERAEEEEWERRAEESESEQVPAIAIPSVDEAQEMDASEVAALLHRICIWRDTKPENRHYSLLGMHEFEQAVKNRCKLDRSFAQAVLVDLRPETDDRVVAMVLSATQADVELEHNPSKIAPQNLRMIQSLVDRGFQGKRFQNVVARKLYDIASSEQAVPTSLVETIEGWLLSNEFEHSKLEDKEPRNESFIEKVWQDDRAAVPAIWDQDRGDIICQDFFWLGEVIKLVDANSVESALSVRWAPTMSKCLSRNFPDRVWRSWLFAAYAYAPDHERFADVLYFLLVDRISVAHSPEAFVAIKKFGRWWNTEQRIRILGILMETQLFSPRQAAGELASLFWLRERDDKCHQLVKDSLGNLATVIDEPFLTGVVHSAAYPARLASQSSEAAVGAASLRANGQSR